MKKEEINKTSFPKLFKEMLVEKNKVSLVPEKVREGIWPFKVESGTIWNLNGCIYFECTYKRVIERKGLFAINGNAIDNRRFYKAKKLPSYLKLSHNIMSVNDMIMYGLRLKEKE